MIRRLARRWPISRIVAAIIMIWPVALLIVLALGMRAMAGLDGEWLAVASIAPLIVGLALVVFIVGTLAVGAAAVEWLEPWVWRCVLRIELRRGTCVGCGHELVAGRSGRPAGAGGEVTTGRAGRFVAVTCPECGLEQPVRVATAPPGPADSGC